MQPPLPCPRRPNGDGINRVEVSGTVTLDGQPLSEGSIVFQPIAEGPSAGGSIRDGRFTIERAGGPGPGKYRVEILAYQSTGRQIPDADFPGKMTDELRQVIPKRYNTDTELLVNVSADGDNHFPLKLQSDQRL